MKRVFGYIHLLLCLGVGLMGAGCSETRYALRESQPDVQLSGDKRVSVKNDLPVSTAVWSSGDGGGALLWVVTCPVWLLLDGIFGWRRTYEGNPLAVTFPMTLLDDASKPLSGVALKSGKNENLETDQGGTARLSFSWDSIPLEKSVWFPINVDLPAWEGLLHEQGDAVEYVPSRFSLFLKCVDGACALLGSDRSPERKFKYKVKTIHHHDDKLAREYQDRKEREAATEQEKLRQERVAAEQDKALKSVRDFTAPDQSLSFGEFIERQSQMALAATFQMFGTVIVQTAYARGINPGIRSPQWSAEYQSGAIYEIQCVLFDVYQKPSSKLIYVWDSEKGTFSGKDKESRGKLKEYTAP